MKSSWLWGALALGACGKVLETPVDGSGDDATTDAPPDVPVRGTLRVTVLDRTGSGAPAVGIPVVFVEPDGTVSRATTDSNGRCEAEVFPGTSVTSVTTVSNGKQMFTVLAVSPGDDVVLGQTNPDEATAGTFTVSWPAVSGANDYTIFGPCGFQDSTAGTVTTKAITLRNSCNPTSMELLVQARNNANATLGFSSKANVAVAAGSTAMPGFVGGISFTGSFTNISHTTNLTMTRRAPEGFGFSDSVTKDVSALTTTTASAIVPSTGSARVETFLTGPQGDSQVIRQRLAGNASTYGLDVAAIALPWLTAPSLDVAARTITIGADPTGTSGEAPDLIQTNIGWRRGATSYGWVVFGPSFEQISLVPLPDELADGLPIASDNITTVRTVAYDADTIPNYAAIREGVGPALVTTLDDAPHSAAPLVRTSTSPPGN
jgi:hypothetical protein